MLFMNVHHEELSGRQACALGHVHPGGRLGVVRVVDLLRRVDRRLEVLE